MGKRLTPKTRAEVTALARDLKRYDEQIQELGKERASVDAQLRLLLESYDLPEEDGVSQYLQVDGNDWLRITRPQRDPVLDAPTLLKVMRREIPAEALEVFHRVARVTDAQLDPVAWGREIERETVSDAWLAEATVEVKPPRPTVVVAKRSAAASVNRTAKRGRS